MYDLLFDVPWWIPTVLVIAGIALWVSGNRRRNANLRTVGLVLVVVAAVWAGISFLVETPKEKCQKQTRALVAAVVGRDWSKFDSLLDPSADFRLAGSSWDISGREALETAVKEDVDRVGVKSARITDIRAERHGDTVTVSITVWSDQSETMDQPIDSDWETDWRETGGRWLLRQIRAVRVANLSSEEIRRQLPAH